MKTGLIRRVVLLLAVLMVLSLALAPAVAADTSGAPTLVSPSLIGAPQLGFSVNAAIAISDPGAASQTYQCSSVDYGDGTGVQSGGMYVPTGWGDGMPRCVYPDHQYASWGTFAISMTVADGSGNSSTASLTQQIWPSSPIVSAPTPFVILPVNGQWHVDTTASFIDSSSPSAGPWDWTISWGDGTTSSGTATAPGSFPFVHDYSVAGPYQVDVQVVDADSAGSQVGTTHSNVVAYNGAPTLVAPPSSGPVVEGIGGTFNWTVIDPAPAYPYSVHVDWGDGSGSDLTVWSVQAGNIGLPHTYHASAPNPIPGGTTYTATMTVTDALGSKASASQTVPVLNVAPVITAPATISVPEGPMVNVTLATFSDASVGPWSVYVTRGDGQVILTMQTPGAIVVPWDPTWGSRTVTIYVQDQGGLIAMATVQVSTANVAPVVAPISLTWNTNGGQPVLGLPVAAQATFTDPGIRSFPPATETYTCTIDFGDGTGPQASVAEPGICEGALHTYTRLGTFTITIVVVDSNGGSGSSSRQVTIFNNAPQVGPVVVPSPLVEGQAFVATAGFTATNPVACLVDFGNGTGPTQGSITGSTCTAQSHAYPAAGTYTLTFTVYDSFGSSGSAQAIVVIGNVAPVVRSIATSGWPAAGAVVTAQASFNDPAIGIETYTCTVDFGDGSGPQPGVIGAATCSADHIYSQGGLYAVTVTVTDSNGGSGSASGSESIANLRPSVGPISVSGLLVAGANVQASATFTDPWSQTSIYTCDVDYGDGTGTFSWKINNGTCLAPVHVYANPGTYTIWLAVDRGYGSLGTSTTSVTIASAAPIVSVVMSNSSPKESPTTASATFTGSASETYACTIDYGDGTVVAGVVSGLTCSGPAHQYRASGTYTVTVTVTDSAGRSGAGTAQVAYTNIAPWVGGLGLVGYLTVGGTSHAVAAVVDPGQAVETYTCTIDYGDGSAIQSGTWVPTGWSDGLPRCVFPDHVYSAVGSYTLTAFVTDSGGASGSAQFIETITPNTPSVQIGTTKSGAEGQSPMSISATFSQVGVSGGSYTCAVDFGDGMGVVGGTVAGNTCTATGYSPDRAGTFTATVSVTDSYGETGSATATLTVVNAAPVVSGYDIPTPWQTGRSLAARVTFTDPGTQVPSSPETYSCTVNYGDGTGTQPGVVTSNYGNFCAGPLHAYARKGTYTFTATVTDSNGATGAYSTQVLVYDQSPTIGQVSAPTSVLVGSAVTASAAYSPTGLVPADTCTVDYGDGTGAHAATANGTTCTGPSHKYTATGTFTITVKILAGNGFTASSSVAIQVYSLQIGAVTVSGALTEGSAITASAGFTPVGSQTYTCKVDYGDGSGAQAGTVSGTTCKGPSHKYGRPGTFTITIRVTGSKGNVGSSSKTVTVANVLPVVTAKLPSTAKVGTSVSVSASFTDPGTTETYQVVVYWGDGVTTPISLGTGQRSFSASHTYTKAGDYPVVVEVSDDQMAHAGTAVPVIAIYDPARTLSGSGTFASPAGACTLTSKCGGASTASFSVSTSYAKGATTPTGTFTFSATGISFASTSFDWYLVTSGTGMLQGSGKVNGVSGYRFTVFTVDGSPDKILVNIVGPDGFSIYYNTDYTPLKTGSITMK